MANYNYIIKQEPLSAISYEGYTPSISPDLIDRFTVNSYFDQEKHIILARVYDIFGNFMVEFPAKTSQLGSSAGAGRSGATGITVDPKQDAIDNGFQAGDVLIQYDFLNDLLSDTLTGGELFIKSLSPDRTEIRAASTVVSDENLKRFITDLKRSLEDESYFSEFYVRFQSDSTVYTGINIGYEETASGVEVFIKLYESVAVTVGTNTAFHLYSEVSDSVLFEVTTEIVEEKPTQIYLKGPNFDVEVTTENKNPTQYLDYNELFSYPVTGSYYELYSLFNEKSAEISVDHTDYANFIHFSSAEERLRNFKYKLDLIDSYQTAIASLNTSGYTRTGYSGSRDYYQNLIKGIVNNFDHYDRYLYYESGSKAWPKSNSTRPFINQASSTSESVLWFSNQITSASNYDSSNFDILINTIPTYIREDSENEPYLMFTHMIGNHFDNLWIYFKAVSDKYDADNRLDFGISKDLVRDAIESLGVKLYSSNASLDNLFAIYTGESYNTGSEVITSESIVTSGSTNSYLQPMPKDSYQKEVYKRIYHNIPHLVKTKGTERGLRALINCFGIPDDILKIKTFGGTRTESKPFFGPLAPVSSSLDKVRLDNTGSIVSGSTLSTYTSIVRKEVKYSDDQNVVEVGFRLSEGTDNFINSKIQSTYNIDDYIGDPRVGSKTSYEDLDKLVEQLDLNTVYTSGSSTVSAGTVDPSFSPSIADDTYAVASLSDNSVILVGGSASGYVNKYNSDGTPNAAFNLNVPTFDAPVRSIYILTDGSILVGGAFTGYLKKLNSDGTENTAFTTSLFTIPDLVRSITVLPDNRIVIGGGSGAGSGFLLVVDTDGTENTTFTTNLGAVIDNAVNSVKVLSDGTILAGGFFTGNLKKFSNQGVEDTVFTTNATSINSTVYSVAEFSDGSILVGGFITGYVQKLTSTGVEISSFSTNANIGGTVITVDIDSTDHAYIGGIFTGYLKKTNSLGILDTMFNSNYNVTSTYVEYITHTSADLLIVAYRLTNDLKRIFTSTAGYVTYHYTQDPKALIRLVKFFDTSIFRMIKDFLPARTKAATGIIVDSHKLHRNKAKQVQVSFEEKQYTGSIEMETITGSNGGVFGVANDSPYTTNYSASYVTPLGRISRNVTDESPRVTGEFSGSNIIATNGNLTANNPFLGAQQPVTKFDFTLFNLSTVIPKACGINFTSTYEGEAFYIAASGNGTVSLTAPTTIAATGSFNYAHDFITDGATFTAQATSTGGTFQGWYTTQTTGGILLSSTTSLSVDYATEFYSGSNYYARFI